MSQVLSVRLPEQVATRLREHAGSQAEATSTAALRLVDEGLRMAAHPGTLFKSGPTGRRAAVVGGPDVWEVVGLLRSLDQRGDKAISEAAAWLSLTEGQIRSAADYYADFPDEIDARIEANDRAAETSFRRWEAQQALLA